MKDKHYEIKTISDLMDVVNHENIERISTDLICFVHLMNETFNQMKKDHKELKDLKNSEIGETTFVWIDDGKHDWKGIKFNETLNQTK